MPPHRHTIRSPKFTDIAGRPSSFTSRKNPSRSPFLPTISSPEVLYRDGDICNVENTTEICAHASFARPESPTIKITTDDLPMTALRRPSCTSPYTHVQHPLLTISRQTGSTGMTEDLFVNCLPCVLRIFHPILTLTTSPLLTLRHLRLVS